MLTVTIGYMKYLLTCTSKNKQLITLPKLKMKGVIRVTRQPTVILRSTKHM